MIFSNMTPGQSNAYIMHLQKVTEQAVTNTEQFIRNISSIHLNSLQDLIDYGADVSTELINKYKL